MKLKTILILCLFCISLQACFTNRLAKSDTNYLIEEEEYSIKLLSVSQNNMMNAGGTMFYQSVREQSSNTPGKFYKATISIENKSNHKLKLDLRNYLLCNKKENCLQPKEIHMKSMIDGNVDPILELKAKSEKGREIYFMGPAKFAPMYLVNQETGRSIKFDYK